MDEHDDDLESEVHEEMRQEIDSYPATADELDEALSGETEGKDQKPNLDDDESEL